MHKLEAKIPQLINLFDIPIGEGNIYPEAYFPRYHRQKYHLNAYS